MDTCHINGRFPNIACPKTHALHPSPSKTELHVSWEAEQFFSSSWPHFLRTTANLSRWQNAKVPKDQQYGHCLKQSITMVLRGCMAWFYSLAMIFGGCPNHFFWGKIPHFPKPTEVWSRVTTICSGAAPWDTLALSEASWLVAEWPPNPRTWHRVESQSSWLGDSMGKSANKSATQLVELVQWKLNPNFLFMRLIVVAQFIIMTWNTIYQFHHVTLHASYMNPVSSTSRQIFVQHCLLRLWRACSPPSLLLSTKFASAQDVALNLVLLVEQFLY